MTKGWHTAFERFKIHIWHGRSNKQPGRSLGFPIIASLFWRKFLESRLITSIQRCDNLYTERLPLKGPITVINSLMLSKLWYLLRMVSFLRQIRSAISKFVSLLLMVAMAWLMLNLNNGSWLFNGFVYYFPPIKKYFTVSYIYKTIFDVFNPGVREI